MIPDRGKPDDAPDTSGGRNSGPRKLSAPTDRGAAVASGSGMASHIHPAIPRQILHPRRRGLGSQIPDDDSPEPSGLVGRELS